MTSHAYQYATTIQHGVELGVIKCDDFEPFIRFDDALARAHRPDDERVIIWNGVGTWGPEALVALLPPLADWTSLDWKSYSLTVPDH